MVADLPFYNKILVTLIDLIGTGLAILVYQNKPKARLNQIFILMIIGMFFWVNFAYFARLAGKTNIDLALIFLKIAWFFTPLFFILIYFLVIYLLGREKRYSFLNKIVFFLGVISAFITSFTNLIVKGIDFLDGQLRIVYGSGMLPFLGVISFFIFVTLFVLFKQYLISPPDERRKIEYFLVGISIFYLTNLIFNIALPLIFRIVRFYWIGDYSTIFLLGFTAYAIVKRELFGIKVVLTALLVGLIAILLLLDALVLTQNLSFQIIKGIILVIFLYFGYLLIKSVLLEIQRRQEIEKIDRAKSEFISIASHQLRTPLTAVKGYISMILEGTYGQLAEKQVRPLENVYQSNERLIKLVNDLLNLSRLDAGKIEFSPELISLEEMVSDIIEELRINAEKKGLYMKMVKSLKSLPKIMVDQDKLRQVILNIVDNAIKYTKEGGVTIELKKLDEQEEIKVSDTGEGMDEKELNSLFQMFSRATAGTQLHAEGAGLGLYVARQFIEMHGGKIWAESPGKSKGSTFYIQLPIHLDPKLLKTKTKTITKAPDDIF